MKNMLSMTGLIDYMHTQAETTLKEAQNDFENGNLCLKQTFGRKTCVRGLFDAANNEYETRVPHWSKQLMRSWTGHCNWHGKDSNQQVKLFKARVNFSKQRLDIR